MIREVIETMADIGRPKTGKRTRGTTLDSQLNANRDWAEANQFDKITIRVPKGTQEFLKEYVKTKANESPENTRYSTYISSSKRNGYQPSVNALIRALLEEELGFSLDTIQEHLNED